MFFAPKEPTLGTVFRVADALCWSPWLGRYLHLFALAPTACGRRQCGFGCNAQALDLIGIYVVFSRSIARLGN